MAHLTNFKRTAQAIEKVVFINRYVKPTTVLDKTAHGTESGMVRYIVRLTI